MPSQPLRAALLGTGAVARFHASALKTLVGVELVAAAGPSNSDLFASIIRSRIVTARWISYSGPSGWTWYTFALRQRDRQLKRWRHSGQVPTW